MLTMRRDNRQFYKAIELCHKVVDDFIDGEISRQSKGEEAQTGASLSEQKHKYIMLRELVKETKDRKFLRDQAINILHAGRDTIGGLLSWTVRLSLPPSFSHPAEQT